MWAAAIVILIGIFVFPEAIAVLSGMGFVAVLITAFIISGHGDAFGLFLVFGIPCLLTFIASCIIAGMKG
jgi:hypothetical protein